ncbi:MAG: threonine/serine exporter [Dorea sp.]|jgi:uncharacterized membrane protein YjjB (DUF3815 family)|nr:threonine/serine exporter [Dorea sp.]MCI9249684.1 threonine/serine exporter [Dorea sp.]
MTVQEIFNHALCSFVGTVSFAVIYNVPRKYYFACGVTGMAGWMTYLLVNSQSFMSVSAASFFGAFAVVLISRILTIYMKCPITVFLVSGILPLVPGAGVYYTAYYIVTNQLTQASLKGMESFKVAFAIVMGIVLVVSIPREVFHMVFWRKKQVEAPK